MSGELVTTNYWMGPLHIEKNQTMFASADDRNAHFKIRPLPERQRMAREMRAFVDSVNKTLHGTGGDDAAKQASTQMGSLVMGARFRSGGMVTSYLNGLAMNDVDIRNYNAHVAGEMKAIMDKFKADQEALPEADREKVADGHLPSVPAALPEGAEWEAVPDPADEDAVKKYNEKAKEQSTKVICHALFRNVKWGQGFETVAHKKKREGSQAREASPEAAPAAAEPAPAPAAQPAPAA